VESEGGAGGNGIRALAINLAPHLAGVQLWGEWRIGYGEWEKQRQALLLLSHSPFPHAQAIALSMICVSWVRLTAPIWVACTLPSLNTIRVGMLRTL
jgi:hypothetical protein